jgi:hypothetical protein
MDILEEARNVNRKSFLSHVFSTTEEGKAELLNVSQYACLGVIPIVLLNKLIQRFIPEADHEKSSLEITIEVFLQIIVMFCGIILIHRIISYIPTYSGFNYENLTLTNAVLAFMIIVLSIQTKLGIKVNILAERLDEIWNGPSEEKAQSNRKSSNHNVSQADYSGNSMMQNDIFPPAPVVSSNNGSSNTSYNQMSSSSGGSHVEMDVGPMPANAMGSSFGTFY